MHRLQSPVLRSPFLSSMVSWEIQWREPQLEPRASGAVEEGVEVVTVGMAYTGMAAGSSLPAVPLWFGSMISGAPLLQTAITAETMRESSD